MWLILALVEIAVACCPHIVDIEFHAVATADDGTMLVVDAYDSSGADRLWAEATLHDADGALLGRAVAHGESTEPESVPFPRAHRDVADVLARGTWSRYESQGAFYGELQAIGYRVRAPQPTCEGVHVQEAPDSLRVTVNGRVVVEARNVEGAPDPKRKGWREGRRQTRWSGCVPRPGLPPLVVVDHESHDECQVRRRTVVRFP